MTEYEVIDALISLRTEIANHSMNFVTVMFGYVVAAYLVGKRLTVFQVSVITILYIIWSPGPMMAAFGGAIAARELYMQNKDILSVEMGASPLISNVPIVAIFGMGLSWIMTIVFMFQVRASK